MPPMTMAIIRTRPHRGSNARENSSNFDSQPGRTVPRLPSAERKGPRRSAPLPPSQTRTRRASRHHSAFARNSYAPLALRRAARPPPLNATRAPPGTPRSGKPLMRHHPVAVRRARAVTSNQKTRGASNLGRRRVKGDPVAFAVLCDGAKPMGTDRVHRLQHVSIQDARCHTATHHTDASSSDASQVTPLVTRIRRSSRRPGEPSVRFAP